PNFQQQTFGALPSSPIIPTNPIIQSSPVVAPIDVSSINKDEIMQQIEGGELPPIQTLTAIINAPKQLGDKTPKDLQSFKEYLLDRIINNTQLLMKAFES